MEPLHLVTVLVWRLPFALSHFPGGPAVRMIHMQVCGSTCTAVLFQTLMLSALLSSQRLFSIPHDSNADVFGRGRGDGLEVRYRECLHVAGQSSWLWRRRFQLHLVAGGHRSNNKTPESKSDLLHNTHHTLSGCRRKGHMHMGKMEKGQFCCIFGFGFSKVLHGSVNPLTR